MSKTVTVVDVLAGARRDVAAEDWAAKRLAHGINEDGIDRYGIRYGIRVEGFISQQNAPEVVKMKATAAYLAQVGPGEVDYSLAHGFNVRAYTDPLGRAIEACIAEGK